MYLFSVILIIKNPIYLAKESNPFVLSTNDNYYYLITEGKSLKIKKESGEIESIVDNIKNSSNEYFYISDNSYNNYIFYPNMNKYQQINYNLFISFSNELNFVIKEISGGGSKMIKVGSISKYNDFVIYGYKDKNQNFLLFSGKSQDYRVCIDLNININDNLSCKFIKGESYFCAIIADSYLKIYCLRYHIEPNNSKNDSLKLYQETKPFLNSSILDFSLYYTPEEGIKFLYIKKSLYIEYMFFSIVINYNDNIYDYGFISYEYKYFELSSFIIEKNCYFSQFNSEYLFCCALIDYITCRRINITSHLTIKEFNIHITGANSHLTIKSNNDYVTFFFMNNYKGNNSVYEYYIYLPECNDRDYTIFESINENKNSEDYEKLSNLFTIKTNKYYFELDSNANEFEYFTLNGNMVNQRTLIDNNNYTLDFIKSLNDYIPERNSTIIKNILFQ